MSVTLISAVPLVMLGLAELLVITSGRGGIDLSVGAIVSLTSMVFGFAYGEWGWPLWAAILLAAAFGGLCGAVNGFLIAFIGYPALITTLATYYAFSSLAIVINDQQPISTDPIQAFFSAARSVPIGGGGDPLQVPLGILTFLLPTAVVIWLAAEPHHVRPPALRHRHQRRGGAVVGHRRPEDPVPRLRGGRRHLRAGRGRHGRPVRLRPPRRRCGGNGMALPAITIAVLGGVAITGGIGRVAGVVLATLLIVWLNAGILLAVPGNAGSQFQLFALGTVLIFAALLNGLTQRKYGGTG